MSKSFPFKIGADPEFIISIMDRPISASSIMSELLGKNPTLRKRAMGWYKTKVGEIGYDGCASTAELRPEPSNEPQKVVENIGELLKELESKIAFAEFRTTSEFASVGGHIHLEIPDDMLQRFSISGTEKEIILFTLSTMYLPLLIGENRHNRRIRTHSPTAYGNLNDFRIETKNSGATTLECRMPTAEWLTTPRTAMATMSYLGVIWNELMYHPESFKNLRNLLIESKDEAFALTALSLKENSIVKNLAQNVRKEIRKFEKYEAFKEEIELAMNDKKMLELKKKANYDANIGWNMTKKQSPTKRELLNNHLIKEKLKDMNRDRLRRMTNIPYNDDMNVSVFAHEMTERIIALNWRLKNNYFLFGLKTGIDTIIAGNTENDIFFGQEHLSTDAAKEKWKDVTEKMRRNIPLATSKKATLNDRKTIFIGLPYAMRLDPKSKNKKEVIGLIASIEKNRIKPKKLEQLTSQQGKTEEKTQFDTGYTTQEEQNNPLPFKITSN